MEPLLDRGMEPDQTSQREKECFPINLNDMKLTYGNNRWVYTILDPVATVILSNENAALSKWTDNWMRLGNAASSANSVSKSQQNASQTQKQQNPQKGK